MFSREVQGDANTIRFRLHLRHGGKLGLPARSTIRNNQKPGNSARDFCTHVSFDQAERQVDSGGDARRRPDVAVHDIDAIALDAGTRETRLQLCGVSPVRSCFHTVQQAGFRKQKRSRTHACHPRGPGAQFPGSGDVLRCLHRLYITAHENDGVKCAPSDRHGLDHKTCIATNRASVLRDDMKIVRSMASGCGDLIKSRQWPTEIESVVATAYKESNSMHDGVVSRISREGVFYGNPSNRAILGEDSESSFAATTIGYTADGRSGTGKSSASKR